MAARHHLRASLNREAVCASVRQRRELGGGPVHRTQIQPGQLVRRVEGRDGELRRHQMVARGDEHQQRRGADVGQVAARLRSNLAVKLAIGVVLVWIAIRQRRRMGKPKPPKKPPKWQEHVDNMSPWLAMALAPALQPWGLIGAGAATVVEAKLSSWESYLALFGFCVLASASYLALEIYAGFRPRQSEAFLARFRTWMKTRTDQVIILGSLILGFWLIANSIYLIVT